MSRRSAEGAALQNGVVARLEDAVTRFDVPGAAVGIIHEGNDNIAVAGVTSTADPLAIDADTLFMIGSTSKTLTATVAMSLVERGLLHLDRPLSSYLPTILDCPDDVRAQRARVLVQDLFTHTAGWLGDVEIDTGPGDDAYARLVTEALPKIPQHTPPGDLASYNNKSTAVAARLIETVTGEVFETTLRDRLLVPLGLQHTFVFPSEIANRRHAIGHATKDGRTVPVPDWPLSRCEIPEGGVASSVTDQLRYARFHLTGARRLVRRRSVTICGAQCGSHARP